VIQTEQAGASRDGEGRMLFRHEATPRLLKGEINFLLREFALWHFDSADRALAYQKT
jgi:hypothetical protein